MEDKMNIQWYPGHMTKTRRQMEADLKRCQEILGYEIEAKEGEG